MAQSYSGAGTKVLVAGTDSAGDGVAYDLAGLCTGGSFSAGAQLDPGYYIGSSVQRQPYIGYSAAMSIDSLRKGPASEAMAEWVRGATNPEGWVAFVLGNGAGSEVGGDNLAVFASRRFMSSSFTVEFSSIVGHDIGTEPGRDGVLYQGDAEAFELTAAGSIDGIATSHGTGVRALLIVTALNSGGTPSVAVGGQTIEPTEVGAYLSSADLSSDPSTATVTGTFTEFNGWLLVGRGLV